MFGCRMPAIYILADRNLHNSAMRKISKLEAALIPIMLVALIIISALVMTGNISNKEFTIASLAIITVSGLVTLINKEAKLNKIFELFRLAIGVCILCCTHTEMISLKVTVPIVLSLSLFSFCCLSNSLLPLHKYWQQKFDSEYGNPEEIEQERQEAIRSLEAANQKKTDPYGTEWTLIAPWEPKDYLNFAYWNYDTHYTLRNGEMRPRTLYYKAPLTT